MCVPTPCTSSRARVHNRTNVQLWRASPHECALLQLATVRFVVIHLERYLSGLTPLPTHQTNQPTTTPRSPQNPAPASSITGLKSERHHSKCLRMVGAPTYPNDGDYPAHSSTQRSSNAPTARPQGQQRSEASSQTSSPEAQRGSGTATRPAAPPPLLRIAAAPQPQHRR